ncbi:type II toxin-antitoxin system VapC family toxin [Paracoccus sp. SY]|uniref:type II toxin-antitoxin system VapC family toxin n=1 Tax=Paracoccus sp. SY TaxID=1330255 RepID=UPI000CD1D751|nr:type II toxin-antitoxin system VapC family toxin [Paracoccus sp. SY]
MNLLLDTHLLLWAAFRPDRLSPDAAAMIADPGNRLWFSAASIWEVAIKRSLDRPDFRVDPGVLRAGLLANDYAELPIAGRHCLGLSGLPALHADPFDRILIAQALAEGMMLLTSDARVAAYPGPIRAV